MATTTQVLPQEWVELTGFERFLAELRVLLAIAKKEWLYVRRYPTWMIALFIWPVIFPLGYILSARALSGPDQSGLALFIARTGISDYLGYIAVGTTVWMWQNVVLWNVGFALRQEQWRGTLETNWMAPVWRFSFLIGPSLVQMLQMTSFILISTLEFGLLFGVKYNGNPLLVLLVFLVSIPAVYGLGIAFASAVVWLREAGNFVQMVRGFVMIFCGMTYPITLLPGWMRGVADWLPQTYMMHAIRAAALANASLPDLMPDITALLGFGAFFLALGYVMFVWTERKARRAGVIGQY